MKLTINVPDSLIRTVLCEQLTRAGIKKVLSDPRFHRAMQRDAQTFYEEAFVDAQGEFVREIAFNLRIAKKYYRENS